jgi:AP-2 complex subunit sigma-1
MLYERIRLHRCVWADFMCPQVHRLVAPRDQKYQSNFVEFRNNKIVYRRYAGLFFCACVDANDNELAYLEAIHFFVEVLDSFFGNVCELDLVFNFYKVRKGESLYWTE